MKNCTLVNIMLRSLGGWDNLLKALTILIVVNIITTVLVLIVKNNDLNRLTFKVFSQKTTEFLLVGICNVIDTYLITEGDPFRKFIIVFYIAYEGLRILDNAVNLGVPVPNKIQEFLEYIFKKEYSKDDKTNSDNT